MGNARDMFLGYARYHVKGTLYEINLGFPSTSWILLYKGVRTTIYIRNSSVYTSLTFPMLPVLHYNLINRF